MTNATYIAGTIEYLFLEVAASAPGFAFVPSEWTAKVALVALEDAFDDDAVPSIWEDATLETIDSVDYAKVILGTGGISVAPGRYRAYIRLTKTMGGTETPLLRALGTVTVES